MNEGDKSIVIGIHSGTMTVELRVHTIDRSEEYERLVHQVAAEVEEYAAGVDRLPALAPGARRDGTPTVETRLEAQYLAKRSLVMEAAHREEVTVPTSVLEDGQHQSAAFGIGNEGFRLRGGRSEWFVDYDRDASIERPPCERYVGAIRRGNDDEVDTVRTVPELLRALHDVHARVVPQGPIASLSVAGDHRGYAQAGGRRDQGRVKECACRPISDHADT
ncbi:MAG: hypothetical protein NVS1B4_21790 [Gemmatimonadaceae bacterium]